MKPVLNINNIDVIGQIKNNLKPDGIFLHTERSPSHGPVWTVVHTSPPKGKTLTTGFERADGGATWLQWKIMSLSWCGEHFKRFRS